MGDEHNAAGVTKPILIMGPTASGKSALALALAEKLGGIIINADASQVYRDLRLLSARPSAEDEARAPHKLFGVIDGAERYSTGRWLDDAIAAIRETKDKTPIIVGGTGLYFKALTEGLVEAPEIPDEVRDALGKELDRVGVEVMHGRLDPEDAERIRPSDTARVLRALEILEVTGGSFAELQETKAPPALKSWVGVALTPDRERTYATIESRFDQMIAAGALEEIRALAARDLNPDLPVMKALGAPWLIQHVRGELSLDRAVELAKRDTRRYAKRQFTWMGGQMRGWPKIEAESLTERIEAVFALLSGIDGNVSIN
jgi:tRNA dimethylallyltransferase